MKLTKRMKLTAFTKKMRKRNLFFLSSKINKRILHKCKRQLNLGFSSTEILKILKSEPWIFLRIDHSDIDQISQIFV